MRKEAGSDRRWRGDQVSTEGGGAGTGEAIEEGGAPGASTCAGLPPLPAESVLRPLLPPRGVSCCPALGAPQLLPAVSPARPNPDPVWIHPGVAVASTRCQSP